MKFYLPLLVLISCIQFSLGNTQEPAPAPVRTPEQEAALQTQKMQKELNLNKEQLQSIYDINLKHARERQVSNSRSKALERSRNKNSEIKQVLTPDQYNRLQDKRYERQPAGGNFNSQPSIPQQKRTQPVTERRSTPDRRTVPDYRTVAPSTNRNTQVNPSSRNSRPMEPNRPVNTGRPSTSNSGSSDRTQRR
jgi:Spy/CpxP family protein refolding chaperone